MTRRPRRLVAIPFAAIALSGAVIAAQDNTPTFRASVDLVFVPVSVTDGTRPITGLKTPDFQLLDNGVPQDLTSAAVQSLAVDVTLLLDASGSVTGRALDQFKADVKEMTTALRPVDRVRLLTFATNVTAAGALQPGGTPLPVDSVRGGGATSFYDALATALIAFPQNDRPHVIFAVSDGLDNMSFLDARQVSTFASQSSAALYLTLVFEPVVLSPMMPFVGPANVRLLDEAVAKTGGMLYQRQAGTPLPDLFKQALADFRTTYVLTYTPKAVKSGGWHEIEVSVKGKRYVIRSRKGYDGG